MFSLYEIFASLSRGSDPTAAGGGGREGSEWPRSARDEGALTPRTFAGNRNRGRIATGASALAMTGEGRGNRRGKLLIPE